MSPSLLNDIWAGVAAGLIAPLVFEAIQSFKTMWQRNQQTQTLRRILTEFKATLDHRPRSTKELYIAYKKATVSIESVISGGPEILKVDQRGAVIRQTAHTRDKMLDMGLMQQRAINPDVAHAFYKGFQELGWLRLPPLAEEA